MTDDLITRLNHLRDEIDALDKDMHHLIMKRWNFVKEIGALKAASADDVPIRPLREAMMFKALLERHQPPFPTISIEAIWHELISAYTQLQKPYEIILLVNDSISKQALITLYDQLRLQFGHVTNIEIFHDQDATANRLIHHGNKTLVICPLHDSVFDWWSFLYHNETQIKAIMALPFLSQGQIDSLVFAHNPTEYSDDNDQFKTIVLSKIADENTLKELGQFIIATPTPSFQILNIQQLDESHLEKIEHKIIGHFPL